MNMNMNITIPFNENFENFGKIFEFSWNFRDIQILRKRFLQPNI